MREARSHSSWPDFYQPHMRAARDAYRRIGFARKADGLPFISQAYYAYLPGGRVA